jgi:hypothetical protein
MSCKYYYDSNPGTNTSVVDKTWVSLHGGVDPDTATPAELAAAGFYCFTQSQPPVVNPQIYTVESSYVIEGTNATQEYTVVALPLTDSKETYTSEVKSKAYNILQPTDWMVVRQVEESTPVPTEWQEWRQAVRLESSTKIAAIEACDTYEELHEYVSSEAYSTWPASPDSPDAD